MIWFDLIPIKVYIGLLERNFMFTSKDAREWRDEEDRKNADAIIAEYVVKHKWKKKPLLAKIVAWAIFLVLLGVIAISLG